MTRGLITHGFGALALSFSLALFGAHGVSASDLSSKADSQLLSELESGTVRKFTVVLSEQADLSGAERLGKKEAKGRFVFEKLRETASRTQAPIVSELVSRGLIARPYFIANEIVVEVPAGGELSVRDALSSLALRGDVSRILHEGKPFIGEAPLTVSGAEPERPVGWNVRAVGARRLHRRGITGQNIVVGILDSGADANHEAISATYAGALSGVHDYNWFDPTEERTREPTDTNGHGTHTTGVIAGSTPTMPIGVAPEAQWIHCRGLGPGSSRETVLSCLQFFLAPTDLNGENPNPIVAPDITNNSYICPFCELETAFGNLNAAGIISVAASANFGPTCGSIFDPGTYAEVISVGATMGGGRSKIADFSSRGGPEDPRIKPEIVAPGQNILSAAPGNQYAFLSGTSEAAPHVAGAIALFWDARPAFRGRINPTRRRLFRTAVRRKDSRCGTKGEIPNNVFGFGFVDALAAAGRE